MVAPRPRPGAKFGQAPRVDLDNRDVPGGRTVEDLGAGLGEAMVDWLEGPRGIEQGRQDKSQRGQRQSLAAPDDSRVLVDTGGPRFPTRKDR